MSQTKIQFLNDKVKIFDISKYLSDYKDVVKVFESIASSGANIYYFDGTPITLVPTLNLVLAQDPFSR